MTVTDDVGRLDIVQQQLVAHFLDDTRRHCRLGRGPSKQPAVPVVLNSPPIILDPFLAHRLRQHQVEGVRFLFTSNDDTQ